MLNIQKNTISKLSAIKFDERIKSIKIGVYSDNTLFNRAINNANFNLENGLSIKAVSNANTYMEVTLQDGNVFNASKWLNYKNFFFLSRLFSEDNNPGREVDNFIFNEVAKIHRVLFETSTLLSRDLNLKQYDKTILLVDYPKENYKNLYSFDGYGSTPITRYNFDGFKSEYSHYALRKIFNLYFSDVDNYDKFLNSEHFETEQNIYERELTSLNSFLMLSLADISLESISLNPVSYDADDILNEKSPYILIGQQSDYVGSVRYNYELPVSVLDRADIRYSYCEISKQPATIQNCSSTRILRMPYVFYENDTYRNPGVVVSGSFIKANLSRVSCSRCGSYSYYFENHTANRIKNEITEAQYDELIKSIKDVYPMSAHTNGDDGEHLCQRCAEEDEKLSLIFKDYNGRIRGNRYEDDDTSFEFNSYDDEIHSYDYEPYFSLHHLSHENDEDLHLGVELEIDRAGEDNFKATIITKIIDNGGFIYPMHDGSLNDGFEMTTMPATLAYHLSYPDYKKGFDVAKKFGYRSHDTDTCGLHVHMNRRFFGSTRGTQNIKAAYMALILERNWNDIVKFSRRNYHDIEEWANKQDLDEDVDTSDIDEVLAKKFADKYSDDKYVALNTMHSASFELRIFKGTLNYNTFAATLQFVSNLANIAKECTSLAKAQQITFNDIVNYKKYDELSAYLQQRNFTQTD